MWLLAGWADDSGDMVLSFHATTSGPADSTVAAEIQYTYMYVTSPGAI